MCGCFARKVGSCGREPVRRELGRQGEPDPAGNGAAPFARARSHGNRRPLHRFGARDDVLAVRREQVPGGGPVEERNAKLLLEHLEPARDGRVLHAQPPGSGRHPASPRDGEEYLEIVPVQCGALLHNECAYLSSRRGGSRGRMLAQRIKEALWPCSMTAEVPGQTKEGYEGMLAVLGPLLKQAKGFIAHGAGPSRRRMAVV